MCGHLYVCRARPLPSSRREGWLEEVGYCCLLTVVLLRSWIGPHSHTFALNADDEDPNMFVNWWDNPTNPDIWHKHQVCDGA